MTMGHDIIVGPKTNVLLPPLRHRCVHVLQQVGDKLQEPPSMATCQNRATAFVAGGLKTYRHYQNDITHWFITRIDREYPGATVHFDETLLRGFFRAAAMPMDEWKVVEHWIRNEWLVPSTAWQTP